MKLTAEKIKNVAFAGHSDSGKTSLAEALLFKTKATDRLGKISQGNTVCDFDPEEVKREVSISAAVAPIEVDGVKINIIDTPGLFDFAGGFYEGVRAAETVLVAVNGKDGVTVGAEKAVKLARDLQKSMMFFISKMDIENVDFYKTFSELHNEFGSSVCPVVIPYVNNRVIECYIDLISMKAYKYDDKGGATSVPVPEFAELEEMRAALMEAVAETDEELLEQFLMEEPFSEEQIRTGLEKGMREHSIAPVFCGSAYTMAGIDLLMQGFVHFVPSAKDCAGEKATTGDGKEVMVNCDENAPLSLFVFRTVADRFVGKMSFFKVISGKVTADAQPINARTGDPVRLGKLIYVMGAKQIDTNEVVAGDIGVATKLDDVVTGDSLCDPKQVVSFKPTEFPTPALSMAIVAKAKADESKIAQGLQRLMEEDLTASYVSNAETKQQVISGLGEQHLDVLISKLKSKFGVEVGLEQPRVPYRETIRKSVKVQGRHKKQTGGHGQFGDVWIEFEPCDSDDLVFEEKVFGGSVPKGFFPAVEKGLRDAVKSGPLAGYPVVGVKATLVDGSYHPVDSSEMAFKMAASIAYKDGMPKASPVLLEPIGLLKAYIPDANTGDIMGELNKRRGRVLGMNPAESGMTLIEAEVPMSEMHDFSTLLRSTTQGRGYFTFEFIRYEQLPGQLEEKVIADAKKMREEE